MTELEKAAYVAYPKNISYSTIIDQMFDYNAEKRNIWIDGANWMRGQMMKDAITADIGYYNQHGLSIYPEKSLEKLGFDEHNNVKIVIIKEE